MDITPEAILLRIKRILAELTSMPEGEITAGDVVEDILTGDSLSRVEYLTALETEFGVDLQHVQPNQMDTLESTAIYLFNVLNKDDQGD